MEIRKNAVYGENEYVISYNMLFADDKTDVTSIEIDMENLLEIIGHMTKMVQYNYSGLVPDKAILDIFKYIKHNIKFLNNYTDENGDIAYMFKYKRGELKIYFVNLKIVIDNDGMTYDYLCEWKHIPTIEL